jgi:hypothetical protein
MVHAVSGVARVRVSGVGMPCDHVPAIVFPSALSGAWYIQIAMKKGIQGEYISTKDRDYDDLRISLDKHFGSTDADDFLSRLWAVPYFNDEDKFIDRLREGRFMFAAFYMTKNMEDVRYI